MVDGGRLGDIGAAVQGVVEARRASRSCGTTPATASAGPCTRTRRSTTSAGPGTGPRLRAGNVLAIEPMVSAGTDETVVLDDGWSVVTADGAWAAHAEHTVAVTDDGPEVLTVLP